MNSRRPTNNHTICAIYRNEHLLGSEDNIHAFKAAARTWESTAAERQLNSLSRQVSEDHADLCKIMRTLDYKSHPVKHLLTQGARLVGRVNPVNILRQQKAGSAGDAGKDHGSLAALPTPRAIHGSARAARCSARCAAGPLCHQGGPRTIRRLRRIPRLR